MVVAVCSRAGVVVVVVAFGVTVVGVVVGGRMTCPGWDCCSIELVVDFEDDAGDDGATMELRNDSVVKTAWEDVVADCNFLSTRTFDEVD